MDYGAMSVGNRAEDDAAEGPLPQTVAGSIEKLLARGSERGYVTYDELSATLPLDQLSSEEIEDTMTMLFEHGITVTESDESEEPVASLREARNVEKINTELKRETVEEVPVVFHNKGFRFATPGSSLDSSKRPVEPATKTRRNPQTASRPQ